MDISLDEHLRVAIDDVLEEAVDGAERSGFPGKLEFYRPIG
jgi:hypothetical protein